MKFKITQAEIIKNWTESDLKVSIRCTTYNHSQFISQALDSFLMQKTTFPFEIVVHDDASLDGTSDIIREYEKEFPKVIKAIYETENQYSKRDGSLKRIVDAACHGKYVAFCEGDDYWVDSHKLQKQYDFLESHPNYSACAHNTKLIDLENNDRERIMFPLSDCVLTVNDLDRYHTSSLMCKKSSLLNWPEFAITSKVPGDLKLSVLLKLQGPIYRYGSVMSVYRFGVSGSWVQSVQKKKDKVLAMKKNIIIFYENVYDYVPCSLKEVIMKYIQSEKFHWLLLSGQYKKAWSEYHDLWKELRLKTRLHLFFKYIFFFTKR